jgi:uroporphyrinogen-III synthase
LPDAILVTRPEPGASDTAARLAALGFSPVLAPVMAIVPKAMALPRTPQAVLVTSGNAIPALPATLCSVPLLAVGDATATRASNAGFLRVQSAAGDAAALAALAATTLAPAAGPLLLACGQGQGDALARTLRAQGFAVLRRIAYASLPASALPAAARSALANGAVRAALFFSPRSARIFVTILQRDMPAEVVRGIEALAISQPTQVALRGLPWRRVRVASHPNQDELLKLLQ